MRLLTVWSIIIFHALLLGLWGCDDKPTKPEPVEPKDYYAYFVSQVSEFQYYRYHTGTGLIDSFPTPYSTFHSAFTISPDGKTMFIRPKDIGKLIEFSLDSHVVIAEHPITIKEHSSAGRHQWIVESPDGCFLAINNSYLQIYDLSDYSRIFCDTINVTGFGNFYNSGDDYVCGSWDSNYTEINIRKIDLNNGNAETRWGVENARPSYAIPNRNFSRVYLYSRAFGDLYLFQVYDIASESIIFGKSLCPGTGDLVITPDEHYAIFSQPGTIFSDCSKPNYFTIFDTWANEIYSEVNALVDSLHIVFPVGDLCITPDGRHLIGVGTERGLFDYDLRNHEFIRHVTTDGILLPYSLACQNGY